MIMIKHHYFTTQDKSDCCGCKGCEDVCPTKAIEMQADTEGFWYPQRNSERCTQCDRCKHVCPMCTESLPGKGQNFAAWHSDPAVRDASSSGGIFRPMAQYVIRQGGVVVGAAFDAQFTVKHIIVDQEDQLALLQKSKYVQSDTAFIYKQIKQLLDAGTTVLFSGTPCQVAGLQAYLAVAYDNLISCAVVCFGVPSPMVYTVYKSWLENSYSSPITSINFKDKTYGWDCYTTRVEFANGKAFHRFPKDSYGRMMLSKLSIRPSCLDCHWHEGCGREDILLGDCWGGTDDAPGNGVSRVTVLSAKGKTLFDAIANNLKVTRALTVEKRNDESDNENRKSVQHDDRRKAFFYDIHAKGFRYASNHYVPIGILRRLRYWLNAYRIRMAKRQ